MSESQKTTAQGAGVGALLGAAVGGVIGHQSGKGATGAVVGGLLGAAAGAAYGNHVAGKKAEFASQEDYLDAVLAQAEKVRDDTQQQNQALRTEIASLEKQVATTLETYARNQSSRADALELKQQLEQKLAAANTGLQGITDEIRVQKEVAANEAGNIDSERLARLEKTIGELEAQKAELTAQTEQLADLGSRISV
jgi:chromosome segregation ATPase